jgi:hypothetical protein
LVKLAARALTACHLPAVARRLVTEVDTALEEICDLEAARAVGDPLLVAESLVEVARFHACSPAGALAGFADAPAALDRRVSALCSPPWSESSAKSRAAVWVALNGVLLLALALVFDRQLHDVTEALLRYMEEHELLCVQRQQPGRITWEPLGGFQAAVRRSTAAFGSGKKLFMLSNAQTVAATLMPLEAGYIHVTLAADARGFRRGFLAGGIASVSVGVAATAVLAVLTPFIVVALAPLPLSLGLGYGAVRQYHPKLARIQLGLERVLDHLQQDGVRTRQLPPPRPGIVNLLADEVRKALKS